MQPTEEMISRFLQWQLPEDFNPDGGISFKRGSWQGKPYPMPVGTNLLDYMQTKAMLEFVLATTDEAEKPEAPISLQKRLRQWFDKNGGRVTVARAINRAQEELNELIEAVNSNDSDGACLEEVADVYLCLLLVSDLLKGDLNEAALRKMEKNEARTWRTDYTGALYHVKPASTPEAPKCETCKGIGFKTFSAANPVTCPDCHGTGSATGETR